jgi:bifunctional non-homologous end joining protein LigD
MQHHHQRRRHNQDRVSRHLSRSAIDHRDLHLINQCRGNHQNRVPSVLNTMLRARLAGFIEPCLPSLALSPLSGRDWIHEIKHDGFRLLARRGPAGVRLLTRNGTDFTGRYPLIVETLAALAVRSCIIDGEAVACDGAGLSIFEKLRWRLQDGHVFMWAFDLLELNGQDLRREPIEVRKATLASVLRSCRAGLQFNQHLEHPGDIVFRHACKMGLEGIVSKRLGSRYISGRSRDWLKFKNPAAPAAKREFEEDWGR